ncbi:cytochrome P450 [Auricularia subglabra TFB-10046 SS5]|nr:cytochrome P450 [Auricularia subglabra TFB-10046 SS5]
MFFDLSAQGPVLVAAAFLLVAAVLRAYVSAQKYKARLPPGPPETSILFGNVSNIPRSPEEWIQYQKLSQSYGPVMHLRLLNRHLIVLDTMQAAVDLLEKRGANYSDRARMPMLGELMGYNWNTSLMRYGDTWRLHRRALHQHFHEAALTRIYPNLEHTNARFLKALIETPEDWWNLTHWLTGANIMSVVYGMEDTKMKDDPWIQLGVDTLEMASEAFSSGFHIVDIFPVLKYVPTWFPGAAYKRKALHAREFTLRARDEPVAWVRAQIEAGAAIPSITSALIDAEVDDVPLPDEVIKNCAGIAFIAGADTTLSILRSFLMAMVRNPDIQRKVQEELDHVLPSDRLPALSDRGTLSLPYLEAAIRETYRKYPPVPLGVPHQSIHEDEYEGMRIPAGSAVMVNSWSILQDEHMYPDPATYLPERFLKDGRVIEDILDPRCAVFGFGRRICPGRYFADSEIWLTVATMLYTFDILPARDTNGRDVYPTEELVGASVIAPKKFACRIVPRSEAKKALILGNY